MIMRISRSIDKTQLALTFLFSLPFSISGSLDENASSFDNSFKPKELGWMELHLKSSLFNRMCIELQNQCIVGFWNGLPNRVAYKSANFVHTWLRCIQIQLYSTHLSGIVIDTLSQTYATRRLWELGRSPINHLISANILLHFLYAPLRKFDRTVETVVSHHGSKYDTWHFRCS